ncbi:MAG TPA: hypothetical protein VI731_11675, partial [Bacteroidia bacterium]|nr:hypothetical protein [Bacteroidia bacterium]
MRSFSITCFIGLACNCAAQVGAGEFLLPLTANPAQFENDGAAARYSVVTVDTILLGTGFRDNFKYESRRPDTAKWDPDFGAVSSGVFINRSWAISPPNYGVCTFDGLNYIGNPYNVLASVNSTGQSDMLVSVPFNLSALSVSDSVYLSFWFQPEGRGYSPNPQDSLLLDFSAPSWSTTPTPVWKNIWFTEGFSPAAADSGFHIVMIKLDSASYFANGFRFRFRNYAAQCGSNDHWHIDEVYMNRLRTFSDTLIDEASFVYDAPSFLKDYQAMPFDHYKPSAHMAGSIGNIVRNAGPTAKNITYKYDVFTSTGSNIATYTNTNAIGLAPFAYETYAPIANPPVYPTNFTSGFPQQSDSTYFLVRHQLLDLGRTDSMYFRQKFYNYYAYDDGTAEVGYGLN